MRNSGSAGSFHVQQDGKISTVDDSDHGNSKLHASPHAHDGIRDERGEQRGLNSNERYAYEEFSKYPAKYDSNGNPIDPGY